MDSQQLPRMEIGSGFIAALDQSGGSTPRALSLYGVPEQSYSGDREMFDLVHEMRSRIVTSPGLGGNRILAAILLEDTLERQFDGGDAADYLWRVKNVMSFLKVGKGLEEQVDGVQMMKPMPDLESGSSPRPGQGCSGHQDRRARDRPLAACRPA